MMATIEHSHRSGNNVVGDGYVPDGLLQKAVEQQPGLGRASAVEPELELVQVVLKVGHRRGIVEGEHFLTVHIRRTRIELERHPELFPQP